jgi:hypothetical protein
MLIYDALSGLLNAKHCKGMSGANEQEQATFLSGLLNAKHCKGGI